jgi:hypothetical protein
VSERASFHPNRHPEGQKEQHADENEDSIEIESRIASARRNKCDCTEQEKRSAIQ